MNGPMSRPNNAAAIRGALLVVVAVVVGIYLLRGTDTPTLDSVPAASPTTVQSASNDAGDEADATDAATATTLPGISVATSAPEPDEQDETSDSHHDCSNSRMPRSR
jgi:hypothetical protein